MEVAFTEWTSREETRRPRLSAPTPPCRHPRERESAGPEMVVTRAAAKRTSAAATVGSAPHLEGRPVSERTLGVPERDQKQVVAGRALAHRVIPMRKSLERRAWSDMVVVVVAGDRNHLNSDFAWTAVVPHQGRSARRRSSRGEGRVVGLLRSGVHEALRFTVGAGRARPRAPMAHRKGRANLKRHARPTVSGQSRLALCDG